MISLMGLERVSLQLTSCVMDLKSSKRINYTLTIRLLQRSRGLQNKGPGVKQRDRKLKKGLGTEKRTKNRRKGLPGNRRKGLRQKKGTENKEKGEGIEEVKWKQKQRK